MSLDPACPQTLRCSEPSPTPEICRPEENHPALEMSSVEMSHTDADLLVQNSPDSSTGPQTHPPTCTKSSAGKEDGEVQGKKQKLRTVFTQTQLCVLNDRFQKQRYLTLQQMQELSSLLNLSYKQVKTWFQNQRMKHKRWEKSCWLKSSSGMIQGSASVGSPGLYASYHPGFPASTSGNLLTWTQTSSVSQTWDSQSWSGPSWSSQPWEHPRWGSQPWSPQTCYPQALSHPAPGSWEETLQPCMQFQQNFPAGGLEVAPETAGGSRVDFCTPEALDLFLNYSIPPEEM